MVGNVNAIARMTGTSPLPPWKEAVGYTYVQDKFAAAKLTPQKADLVTPVRIKECPVQMEAELVVADPLMADLPDRGSLILKLEVRIIRTHVEEGLRLPGYPNRIDTNKLRPLFMVFQEYHGMTRRLLEISRLAEVTEENYRVLTTSDVVKQPGDDDDLIAEASYNAVAGEGTVADLKRVRTQDGVGT